MSGRVWFWNREGADTDLYSFTGWRWVMVVAALLGLVWSSIIPPMKAWDEADHTRRAWFLVDGQWMLRSQSCFEEGPECRNGRTMSGGDINAGLQRYIEIWERQNGAQLTQTRPVENTARSVRWDAEHVFAGAPGTAYYFPLIYTPQAVGLALGRLLRLKVQHSYYLARFVTLASTILVLALSFAIFAPTPITLALLMLPMSLFQAVSAGLDPFSSALAILALSCFMRLMVNRAAPDVTLYVLMCASVFLVATSRAHLITMLLFLFVTAWKTGKRYFWFGAMLTTVAIAWWMWMAIPSAVDFRLQRAHSTGQIVQLYLSNPGELLSVLYRNFSDANALQG